MPNIVSKESPRIGLSDFTVKREIGKGTYGTVHLVHYHDCDEQLAMKEIPKVMSECLERGENETLEAYADRCIAENRSNRNFFFKELKCLIAVKGQCQYLLDLEYAFETETHWYLVSKYIAGGDLFDLVESKRQLDDENTFNEDIVRQWMAELVCALQCLKKNNIAHRDIKPENILIDLNGHVRLTDFGFAEKLEPGEKKNVLYGTTFYIAPEMIRGQASDTAVDWWSLGVVMYELLYGNLPFTSTKRDPTLNKQSVFSKITTSGYSPNFSENNVSGDAINLIQMLLQRSEPKQRIGYRADTNIREHSFFDGIDWDKIETRDFDPIFKPNDLSHFKPICGDETLNNVPCNSVSESTNELYDNTLMNELSNETLN